MFRYSIFLLLTFIVSCIGKQCHTRTSGKDIISDCSNQGFRYVPRWIPVNVTILDFSVNDIPLLYNGSFRTLVNLHTLNLYSSRIAYIELSAFSGLHRLRNLDLKSNFLDVNALPHGVFSTVPNLLSLDLSENNFHKYPHKVISVLTKLQNLRMNGINDAVFGDGFKLLSHLKLLTLKPCDKKRLTNGTFEVFRKIKVEQLTLSCDLQTVEAGSLAPLQSVKRLIIKGNRLPLSDLLDVLIPFKDRNMTLIDFSDNFSAEKGTDILTAQKFSLIGQICVKEVNIALNCISYIMPGAISGMKYKNCLEKIDISKNNIYHNLDTPLELFKLTSLKIIDISEQSDLIPKIQNTNSIKLIPRKSHSTNVTFPLPPSLEYVYASHLKVKNTHLININFMFGQHVTFVDLNWSPFDDCNGMITGLDNIQVFKLSGSNCSVLNFDLIRSFRNLRVFDCRKSFLGIGLSKDIDGKFLKDLRLLESINFSGNQLSSLHPGIFRSQYHSLTEVTLSENKFSEFPIEISKFSKLLSIDLSGNRLRYLNQRTLNELGDLNSKVDLKLRIYLDGNMFECNCNSLKFITWTQKTNIILDKNGNYSCLYIDGSHKTTVYAYEHLRTLQNNCVSKFWLIFSICLTVIFIVLIVGSSIAFKYRITLHYWYLSIRRKYRHYTRIDGESKEYKYSAFVAYHHSDYQWVCGPLCSFLEKKKEQTLCLHHRDFLPGSFITDNIFEAISQSRKVILVVSRDFLDSTWCEFELDIARMQMFQECRDLLIVVLLENIPPSSMPQTLLKIRNKVTFLEFDESETDENKQQLFWKRLFEAVVM